MNPLPFIKQGARAGAVAACAVSVAVNGEKFAKGDLDAAQAALETTKQTALGALTGAATGGLAAALSRAFPRLMRGGAGTLAVAATTVQVGADAIRLACGKIDRKQFARRSAGKAAKSTAVWATAKLGAVIGAPLGPVGAGVGGVVGGLVGWAAANRYLPATS